MKKDFATVYRELALAFQDDASHNAFKAREYSRLGDLDKARDFQIIAANMYAQARIFAHAEEKAASYAFMYGGRRWQQ